MWSSSTNCIQAKLNRPNIAEPHQCLIYLRSCQKALSRQIPFRHISYTHFSLITSPSLLHYIFFCGYYTDVYEYHDCKLQFGMELNFNMNGTSAAYMNSFHDKKSEKSRMKMSSSSSNSNRYSSSTINHSNDQEESSDPIMSSPLNLRKLSKLILPPLGVSSSSQIQIQSKGWIISPMDSKYRYLSLSHSLSLSLSLYIYISTNFYT